MGITGRVVVAVIQSPTLLTLTAITSALEEVLLRTSLACRDAFFYSQLAPFSHILNSTSPVLDPQALLRHARNKRLRASIDMYDTMSEIICIWSACVLIIFWDVDTSNATMKRDERIRASLSSAAVQTVCELAADLA